MAWTKREREEAIIDLRELLQPGDTIYTDLRHVSRSGMLRVIAPYIIRHNQPRHIGYLVAKAIDRPYDRGWEGVRSRGVGMDMGFELVYTLARYLFPDGFETWEGYHRNGPCDFDPDGGYALRQRWL